MERRVPNLVIPFAMVGAAAGWLTGRSLAGPMFGGVSSHHVAPAATGLALFLGAFAGFLLQRQCRDIVATGGGPRHMRMLAIVVSVGAISGAGASFFIPYDDGWFNSALLGAAASLVFAPIAAYVVSAARRAARARLGSIVAAADHRAVWVALAVSIGVATLGALPEWEVRYPTIDVPPLPAFCMAMASVGLTLSALVLDLFALRKLTGIERRAETMVEAATDPERPELPVIDLGLGDEVLASVAHGATYRDQAERVTGLLVGSAIHAHYAMRAAALRSAVSSAVIATVIAVHFLAGAARFF